MLTPKLTDILARVPLDRLKQLAGAPSIELLNSLKPQAVSQPGLAEFLVHTSGEAAALTDPAIRDAVIDYLHGPEAVEICQRLRAPTADPISTLRGAIKSPAKFEKFLTYFSLSLSSSFADEAVPASFRATPLSNLRPHQTTSYRRLRRALNPPNKKVLVHMPYGAGKLRMVAVTAADLFRAEADGMAVLWFSSGAQLCEETFEELVRAWEDVGTQPVTVTRAFGKGRLPDLANVVDGIFVFDVEQFASEVDPTDPQLSALATRTSLVVLHDASLLDIPQFAATFDAMDRAGDLKVVGICPSGENGLHAIGRSSFLRLFDETVGLGEGSPIEFLRQAREIDGLELEIFRPRVAYAVPTNADFDVSADDHVRLAQNVERNAELIDRIVTELADCGSVVFFASTADQARTFSGILSFYGGTAITVTSEMPRDARLQQIIRFQQQDDAQVLCVHDVFISGKDVPKVTAVVISTPILPSTKLSETFGRLASGRSGNSGTMKLIVVDDGIPGYPELVQATTHWSESTP
ncbi:DEAD/DEAH box helicase [Agrobacterium tumefaciens]|uniref:DEAD/DEAH box helicase n=1 Tax=Agrobacterium tumefaciens TaxID=358 RepID=UPI003BA210A3